MSIDQPDRAKFIMQMVLAPDLKMLRSVWSGFPEYIRNHDEMIAFKDKLKADFLNADHKH